MPAPLDLSVMIAQMPHAAKIVGTEQAHPEVQQALVRESVLREQQRRRNQVQESDETHQATEVREDGRRGQDREATPRSRSTSDAGEDDGADERRTSPWSGNLVDLEI